MDGSNYQYVGGARHNHAHTYLRPKILEVLGPASPGEILDLGCGNGDLAAFLTSRGYRTIGIDPSVEGVALARKYYPALRFEVGSAYEDLKSQYGGFPIVVSIEVVEHLYSPRKFAATLFDLVEPGGIAVVSTPYHGYLKNLALAVSGKMDGHFTALWDNGHIKFWSVKTLTTLISEVGFVDLTVHRVGRFAALAKSMIVVARKRS
jgi:2-polyprenyl-6-hydroxyphenyl methylase/3-demethylubiquinone-9 3-methyltransferase